MYFYPDQVDDGGLETLCLILLTLNLGRTMDFLDEEKQKLSERALFVQKIYERKCLHPSKNDILNCIFELKSKGLMSLFFNIGMKRIQHLETKYAQDLNKIF